MDKFCISFAQPAVGWGLWLYIKQFIPVAEAFIPAREDDATDGNNMHLQYSKVNWMFPTTQIVIYITIVDNNTKLIQHIHGDVISTTPFKIILSK